MLTACIIPTTHFCWQLKRNNCGFSLSLWCSLWFVFISPRQVCGRGSLLQVHPPLRHIATICLLLRPVSPATLCQLLRTVAATSWRSISLYTHFPESCTQWFLISVVPPSTARPHQLFLLIFLVSFVWSQSPPERRPHQDWCSSSPLHHFPGGLFFTVAFSVAVTATFDNQMWWILSPESALGEILFYLPEH